MEEAFQLSLLAVGLGTSVFGAAELAGEFLTAGLADRVWLVFGIVGTGVTSAAITAFSLASLLWGLRGWRKD